MPIPDFQTLMRPILELHQDGAEHVRKDRNEQLADLFGLTTEEREALLPSGRQRLFDNRVGWAVTHLFQAGLLERPRRGVACITDRGRAVLRDCPDRVDMSVLEQFEEYKRFRARRKSEPASGKPEFSSSTPEETIDEAYGQLRAALAEDLLVKLHESTPAFFEHVVVDLLVAMGYGGSRQDAAERLGKPGDEGFDGVVREDALGLDAIYVQAKKWRPDRPVGRPDIQGFLGALQGAQASKGVFITTSRFAEGVKGWVSSVTPRVVLIDGRLLADLMIDHNVGVAPRPGQHYELKRLDEDYFLDESSP